MEAKNKKVEPTVEKVRVNPLHNEKIYIRFVPKVIGGEVEKKQHPLNGGKADGAFDRLCVPMLRSTGRYKNILTNDEKEFIEEALLMDTNALSVYRNENNYWDNFYVELNKEGLTLDLSNPEDYLKYAVIRANDDIVCPSVQELQDKPKATYQYVIVRNSEENKLESAKMDTMMASYKEFGKIDGDFDKMRILCELLDARPYAATTDIEFFRSRINANIQADPKRFYSQITDPMLGTKVLLRRGVEMGKLSKRGDFYYTKDGQPLCEAGEEPTMSIAARYLNLPSHQDIKFFLESEIEQSKK